MRQPITIKIPGRPIPQQRHRRKGNRTYDPQAELKAKISNAIFFYLPKGHTPSDETIQVTLTFFMPIPKHMIKADQLRCVHERLPHSKRPDIDNLIKFYLDTFNGLLYVDDAQIYNINASKIYAAEPRTEITIEETE